MKAAAARAALFASAFAVLQAAPFDVSLADEAPDDGARLAAPCAGCHGTEGRAPGDTIPRIAGLSEKYLMSSMMDYRSGDRPNEEMARIARGYDDGEVAALARWFASRHWTPTGTESDAGVAREGLRTARNRCASCHGPRGGGGVSGPRLAGQPAAYLAAASAAYRDGMRTGKGAAAKAFAMEGLDDETVRALAHFYAGQR